MDILTAVIVLAGSGLLCGALLSFASAKFAVKVTQTQLDIRDVLHGANCGACGYSGCDKYAEALANDPNVKTNLCVPGADAVSRAISEIKGVPFEDVIEQVAFVNCQGDCQAAKIKYDYEGVSSCSAASIMYGGKWECTQGCLGYGDCQRACPNGAICIENDIAHVNTLRCTGCGICTRTCPQHLIKLIPDVAKVTVTCSNHSKGAVTHAACKNGCIACHKCERDCPAGAITVIDNLAKIDYDKCIGCGICAQNCPVHCIKLADFSGIHRT